MKAKREKDTDAVRMMREIRDNISKETMNMNVEELKEHMYERLKKDQVLTDKKNVYLKLNPILESFRSVVSVRV